MRTLGHGSLLQTALTGGRAGSLVSDSSLHNCEKYKLPILWDLVMVASANTEGYFDPCFFFFFCLTTWHVGSCFPNEESNPHPLC